MKQKSERKANGKDEFFMLISQVAILFFLSYEIYFLVVELTMMVFLFCLNLIKFN